MTKNNCSKIDNECGSVLVFNIFGTFLLMFLGTLAVDASNLYYTARTVRTGAEASALAAASSMDRSVVGWMESRRAGFLALRANDIRGADGSLKRGDLGSGMGPYDPKFKADTMTEDVDMNGLIPTDGLEPQSPYNHVVFVVGNTVITIERGFYGKIATSAAPYSFVSLESSGQSTSIVQSVDGKSCPCPVWEVANAARVTVQIQNQGMLFASLLPSFPDTIPTITQTSVAARSDYYFGTESGGIGLGMGGNGTGSGPGPNF